MDISNLPLFELQDLIGSALAELKSRSKPKGDPDSLTFRLTSPHPLCSPGEDRVRVVVRLEHETIT